MVFRNSAPEVGRAKVAPNPASHLLRRDELWQEIDENVRRVDIAEPELGLQLSERKRLYEEKHGKAKAIGAHAANKAQGNATAKLAVAFTADAAKATILRWLATRKAGKTYREIERAGERTITLMLAKGFVEACGQDRDGLTRVRITTGGREVVRLDDEWERDAEERRQRRGW